MLPSEEKKITITKRTLERNLAVSRFYCRNNNHNALIEIFNFLLKTQYNNAPWLWLKKANCHIKLMKHPKNSDTVADHKKKAIEAFEKVLELDKNNEEAKEGIQTLLKPPIQPRQTQSYSI